MSNRPLSCQCTRRAFSGESHIAASWFISTYSNSTHASRNLCAAAARPCPAAAAGRSFRAPCALCQRETPDELGADDRIVAPDHFVGPVLEATFAGKLQNEFVRNFEAVGVDPHAAFREVGDETEARRTAVGPRRTAVGRNHARQSPEAMTL